MNLNYDSYFLIRDQVKPDLFLNYTCRAYHTLLKKKYTIGTKKTSGYYYRLGMYYLRDSWVGKSKNIEDYIITLIKGMDEEKYDLNKRGFSIGNFFWVYRRLFPGDYFSLVMGYIEICSVD